MSDKSKLESREKGVGRHAAVLFVALFALGWVIVLAADWYFRFARYEWDKQLISRPPRAALDVADRPAFRTNLVQATRGGDLTQLIGIQRVAERFEEDRPAGYRVIDPFGFTNPPYERDAAPDMVVVGDSFMATGNMDQLFSTKLAATSGLFVYNRALFGHGPFVSVLHFMDDPRFQETPPRVVVWGFAEREIDGVFFDSFAYRIRTRDVRMEAEIGAETARPGRTRVYWRAFAPRSLKASLPNTSFMAQVGEWLWNRARYVLFRRITPWVVVAAEPVAGDPVLFYRHHIGVLGRDPEELRLELIAPSVQVFDEYCRERGMELVVVLIPEKEQVYRHALPAQFNPPEDPLPPSTLWTVEQELKARNIRVVNMLAPFREAFQRGERLYWQDDTHWNPHGVQMAAEHVWEEVMNVFPDLVRTGDIE